MVEVPRPIKVLIDRQPTNMQVREKGTVGYYCDVVMCVDQASGFILQQAVLKPDDSDGAVIAVAQETLDLLRQRAPGAEVTWVVRQERIARALAVCCPEVDTSLQPGDSFAPWDEAYLGMDQRLGSGGRLLPYLLRGDITEQEVAELFEAAAHFYRVRPWEFITGAGLLEIPGHDRDDPPLLVSVLGASGITHGITIFDSEADFTRVNSGKRQVNAISLSFELQDKLPPTLTAQSKEHGWAIASKSAFPMVMRVQKGKPMPCWGDDLRRATAALRVLGEVTSAYRESRRRPRRR
jgi:hypothetical protein